MITRDSALRWNPPRTNRSTAQSLPFRTRRAAKSARDIAVGTASLPTRESIFDWIDTEFSLDSVRRKFVSILGDAKSEHKKRKALLASDTFKKKPIFTVTTGQRVTALASWDTPWTLYHHPDVKVDYEKLQKVLIDASKHHYAFAIAQTTQNGRILPAQRRRRHSTT